MVVTTRASRRTNGCTRGVGNLWMGEARCGQLTPAELPTRRTVGTTRDDGYGGCRVLPMKCALLSTYLVTPGSEAGALAGAPPRQRFSGARASLAGRRGRSWSEQQRAGCATDLRGVGQREPRGRDRPNVQVLPHGDARRTTHRRPPVPAPQKKGGWGRCVLTVPTPLVWGLHVGGDLLSHTLPGAVPSALEGLASGFGKGPGVSHSAITTDTTTHTLVTLFS